MREYYHFYQTCPSCHEPHKTGRPLLADKGAIYCPSCNVSFLPTVDLLGSKKFRQTVAEVTTKSGERDLPYLSALRLLWKIQPNQIEEDYINWSSSTKSGKFLVTWPWDTVKFVPLLVSEYLIRNPRKRAVVIGKIHPDRYRSTRVIPAPGQEEAFACLAYLADPSVGLDGAIGKEATKFDQKCVMKKSKTAQYRIEKLNAKYACEGDYPNTLKKSVAILTEDMREAYGDNALRQVTVKTANETQTYERNEGGFVDLHLREVRSYRGKLRYRPAWLWAFLLNPTCIGRPKRQLKCCEVNVAQSSSANAFRLFFISKHIDPQEIFRVVNEIDPDLVVIEDTDLFIKDRKLNGNGFRALAGYLKRDNGSLVIMFSTNPDVRGLYGIHGDEGLFSNSVIPHTWDTKRVIESIKQDYGTIESAYPNPISCRYAELKPSSVIPSVEYCGIECLDRLEDFSAEVFSLFQDRDERLAKDVKAYIYDLQRSGLFVKGDYTRPEVFKRKNEFTGQYLTYDSLMSLINSVTDRESYQKLKEHLESIYNNEIATHNPLLAKISTQLTELLDAKGSFVTVVVHGLDVRGTEKILQGLGFDEFMPEKLFVCKWGDLRDRESQLHIQNATHTIIATLAPPVSVDYSVHFSNASRIIYVAGKHYTDTIKLFMENRMAEYRSRPLYFLSESSPAPETLKHALAATGIVSNEQLNICIEDMIVEDQYYEYSSSSDSGLGVRYKIKAGEQAFLLLDPHDRAMFVPKGASLLVKEGPKLAEVNFTRQTALELNNLLKNKGVIIDTRGVYTSWRAIFTKSAMFDGRDLTFRKAGFQWDGFKQLFDDSTRWIITLQEAIGLCSANRDIPHQEAERKLAGYLSKLELSARDPNYIRSWWTDFEAILTDYGICRLYRVEHPKSPEDVRKIYEAIHKVLPELFKSQDEADRTYVASIFIQKLRRLLLRKPEEDLDPDLYLLSRSLQQEKARIIDKSPVFAVRQVLEVKVAKDIEPLKRIEAYRELIGASG